MREQVEGMVAALNEAGEFLAGATVASHTLSGSGKSRAGFLSAIDGVQTIGPYKILQVIGEGGFGVVYMAEQEQPVRRRVALKIIKMGMDTRQVIARFEAERQALAMMDHPGIAKVFDAGATPEGRPYFAMELVRGESITTFCDAQRLGIGDRLALFKSVCEGVQHAHQRGIIHRDIKPSNVLVALSDVGGGKPVAKIIDFGIAKAVDQRLTEKTLFTEHRQMIGTPEYMSPEQAEMTAVDIDTRADVYSLGVLLYELLTGVTPLDARVLRSAEFAQMQRLIRESEPAKPSTRVHSMATRRAAAEADRTVPKSTERERPTASADEIASRRQCDPRSLGDGLRGELDWIVMKAMEKDRTRRYSSAIALSEDIDRHLRHQPVHAGPQSRMYRAQRLLRRNRGIFAAAAAILCTLVMGLLVSVVGFVSAREQRDVAERERAAAEKLAYSAMLNAALAAIDKYDAAGAKHALELAPRALRGWEWEHLTRRTDRSLVSFSVGVTGGNSVRPLPDGVRAILRPAIGPPALLDLRTGNAERVFAPPSRVPYTASLSPDGRLILVGTRNGSHVMLDVDSGRELWRMESGYVASDYAFSPDSARVVMERVGASVFVMIDAQSGGVVEEIAVEMPPRTPPMFAKLGTSVRYGTGAGKGPLTHAELVVSTGESRISFPLSSTDPSRYSGMTNVQELVVADFTASSERTTRVPCSPGAMSCFDLSHDGSRIAVAETSGLITLWGTRGDEPPIIIARLAGHTTSVVSIEFTLDDRKIVSSDLNGDVKVWSAWAGSEAWVRPKPRLSICEALSPGGEIGFAGFWGLASAFDTYTGARLWSRTLSGSYIVAACFVPERSGVVCFDQGAHGSRLFVLDSMTGRELGPRVTLEASVVSVASGDAGRSVIVGCEDTRLRRISLENGHITHDVPGPAIPIRHIAMGKAGGLFFTAHGNQRYELVYPGTEPHAQSREVWVWDAETMSVLDRLDGHASPVTAIVVSDDANCLVAGCLDGTVTRWDRTGEKRSGSGGHRSGWTRRWTTRASSDSIASVALLGTRVRIAAMSVESSAAVLDSETGANLVVLRLARGTPRKTVFNTDSGTLMVSTERYDGQSLEVAPPPPGGYERREVARAAIAYVDALIDTQWVAGRLREHLKTDAALERLGVQVREAIDREAGALSNPASYLNSECITSGVRTDSDPADVIRSIVIMEEICRDAPEMHHFQSTLGMLYYRAGRYNESIATLERAALLRRETAKPVYPGDLLVRAMAEFQRGGRSGESAERARELIRGAKQGIESQSLRGDYEVEMLLAEADRMLGLKP